MARVIADLFEQLRVDPWREQRPFGDDLQPWHERVIGAGSDEEVVQPMNEWLAKHQPCLFGRLAAKASAITYCVLREDDLMLTDEAIMERIQDRRLAWSRDAFYGRSSAFVVIVASDRIATAQPDATVASLAQRLAFLYLRREIDFDQIYTDEIALEFPGEPRLTRVWHTGVNYFCAQGDGRWWRDHRVPGGLAFSVNSVGHLVRSGRMQNAFEQLSQDLDGEPPLKGYRIDSLEKALEFAMRTISLAGQTASGRATELLPLPSDRSELPVPECPVDLPAFLRDKNFCEYLGRYHTDMTLPREYFLPDVERPESLITHRLDFTYLFHRDIENPDHDVLGDGRRIRTPGEIDYSTAPDGKRARGYERVVKIDDTQLLKRALQNG